MKRWKLFLLIAAWFVGIAAALHALMIYKGTSGTAGKTPESWQKNELVALSSEKPLLLMFAHPRCPCTRASLGELEQLVAQAKDRFEPVVLFYEPQQDSEAWTKTSLIQAAQSVPGVRVILDKEGFVAKQFGVETSGHTVIYNSDGRLLFSGGITGARGHQGENAGFDSVLKVVNNAAVSSSPQKTKVFGCELFDRCTTKEILGKR